MRHTVTTSLPLAIGLGMLSAGPAFSQATADGGISSNAAISVAYVYVQTTQGVNAYTATAAGQLTPIKGSPFATVGQMERVNGKYLISVGNTNIRSYPIESNGAIGKQVSMVNTQNYGGSECGTTSDDGFSNGAVLDHTGKYFYVQLYGLLNDGFPVCAAWQSYQIGSNGSLTFLGDMEYYINPNGPADSSTVPTLSSSDLFAYGIFADSYGGLGPGLSEFSTFSRTHNGELGINNSFTETDPIPNPDDSWSYEPTTVAADSSGHLAASLIALADGGGYCCVLASYTVNTATGGVKSTNTWKNMPQPQQQANWVGQLALFMCPSGKLLAVSEFTGLQLFHFNGAAPIKPYTAALLPTVRIDTVAWDNNNHMYALSDESGMLYVYTATTTSVNPVHGSPIAVHNPYGSLGMVVVPK